MTTQKFSLLFILLFLLIANLPAQSTADAIRITDNLTGFGARALGMGGAYAGVADDYSAVFWNPAGLAQLRKMEFWMGLSHNRIENDIRFLDNPSTADVNATRFNSIGLAFPVPTYRGSLVFAFGYQRVRNFEYANQFSGISSVFSDDLKPDLSFEVDTLGTIAEFFGAPVEKSEDVSDDGSLNQYTAAVAVDVSPNVSVGIGLNYWRGSSDYQLDFRQFDRLNNYSLYPNDFYDYLETQKISSQYSSFAIKLSALMRIGRRVRVGLGMDLPQTFTVKEDYFLENSVSFDNSEIFDLDLVDDRTEYDVKIPFRFNGGVSLAAGPALLSGAFEFTDWTQFKFDSDNLELSKENKFFGTDYRATTRLRAGAEVGLPLLDSQVRGGFIYDPSPLKEASSDNNRRTFTIGYGILVDQIFKIDVAYLRTSWKQLSSDILTPAGTDEDITVHKLFFTLSYRF